VKVSPDQLLSEPSGWKAARISIGSSLAFFSIYAYFELLYDSGLASMLVIGIAMGTAGFAEILPTSRRRLAIVLRVTAIGILVILLVFSLLRLAS